MKIDTSRIDGYDAMSAEEKIKALESLELETPDMSGYVSKAQYDQTASELASKKKELREKMSAEEQQKLQQQEILEQLQQENATLKRNQAISTTQAQLLAIGYDETLARETAEAAADGNLQKVIENQRKYMESAEKRIRADILKGTPRPNGDSETSQVMTLEAFRKMSASERFAFSQQHPDEYRELYQGGQ